MTYIKIDSNSDVELIKQFCLIQQTANNLANDNIDIEDWENKPHTLIHTIFIEKRFDENGLYLMSEDLQSGVGYYPADFDENVCIVSRFYNNLSAKGIGKDNAHNIFYYLLDKAEENGFHGFIETYNEYNQFLLEKVERYNRPDRHSNYAFMAENKNDGVWHKKHFREPGIRITPFTRFGPCIIKHTKQWCLYHLWNETYEQTLVEKIGRLGV